MNKTTKHLRSYTLTLVSVTLFALVATACAALGVYGAITGATYAAAAVTALFSSALAVGYGANATRAIRTYKLYTSEGYSTDAAIAEAAKDLEYQGGAR